MKSKSWETVKDWYDNLVGDGGHYYHQNVILPALLQKFKIWKPVSLLDIACGQGVLSRNLPEKAKYCGVDLSPSLIEAAKLRNKNKNHTFLVGDARELNIPENDFDCATLILAVQDIDDIDAVFQSAYKKLQKGGHFVIVMNHPCYRIPRQSGWMVNEQTKMQSRTINGYLSEMNIPIQTNPGQKGSSKTVTHHHRPLSAYFQSLQKAGFLVENLEEWVSDKQSEGKAKKMEDRARKEFPLFLCLTAIK